jgi:GT2 family glycosyltransferase
VKRLTIGVPTRDRPDQLAALLGLLDRELPGLRREWDVEVLVADGSRSPAGRPGVRVLAVRGGVSAGRNALAAAATGDVLVLVDDDVRPHPGALAVLAAAVAPGTVVAGRVSGLGHRPGEPSQLMVVGTHGYGEPAGGRPADYAVSALLALPRDVYTRVPWDERFAAAHLDDVVYGLRLRDAGVRLALCAGATADHPPRRAADKDAPELAGQRAVVVLQRFGTAPGPWLRCLAHQVWTQRRSPRGAVRAVASYTAATARVLRPA